jgi:site-specific DNA recombinase
MGLTMTIKKTAAAYARFSTDRQLDRSITDQLADCQTFADRERIQIVATYRDEERTSATLFDRDGLLQMMRAAKERRFQAIIVESLDRLSRDQEDLPALFKRLEFYDVELITLNEGVADHIKVGLRGLVGPIQLRDIADKVRRGHRGRAREGKIPGSLPYGYRRPPGKPLDAEIDPDKAKIVRRIFEEYVAGRSPRAIAFGLMKDNVPFAGGRIWNYQNIIGGGSGRHGMLGNRLYVGELHWGTSRRKLSPETGKKVKRPALPGDLVVTQLPHLRIVEQSLFDAANELRSSRARTHFGPGGRCKRSGPFIARSNHLLAGLLRCGGCGSVMRIQSVTRGVPYASCTAAARVGNCDHDRTYNLDVLQAAVLEGMREHLTDPEALAEAARAYHERWSERERQNRTDAASIRKQLNRVQVQIDRLVAAIMHTGTPIPELTDRLQPLEIERAGLTERLRLVDAETNVVQLHPAAITSYRANVIKLHEALSRDALTLENRQAFRNLIDSIVMHPSPKHRGMKQPYEFTPMGRLSAIMGGIDLFPTTRSADEILQSEGVSACAIKTNRGTAAGRTGSRARCGSRDRRRR